MSRQIGKLVNNCVFTLKRTGKDTFSLYSEDLGIEEHDIRLFKRDTIEVILPSAIIVAQEPQSDSCLKIKLCL